METLSLLFAALAVVFILLIVVVISQSKLKKAREKIKELISKGELYDSLYEEFTMAQDRYNDLYTKHTADEDKAIKLSKLATELTANVHNLEDKLEQNEQALAARDKDIESFKTMIASLKEENGKLDEKCNGLIATYDECIAYQNERMEEQRKCNAEHETYIVEVDNTFGKVQTILEDFLAKYGDVEKEEEAA